MSFQERIIQLMKQATDDIFRTARAIPADKLDWKPGGEARSAIGILQEVAQSPTWVTGMMQERRVPDFKPEDMEKMMAMRNGWDTVDKCEEACRRNAEAMYPAILAVPDADLDDIIVLPFLKEPNRTVLDCMQYYYWNAVYHLGQISYIQLLYGDKEMY